MSMNPVDVTPEMVTAAASSCRTTAGEIDGQLVTLKNYVIDMHGRWGGIAADQWQDLMTNFDIYAKMLHNSLTDIATGLDTNSFNYVETELANIAGLKDIDGDIPGARL